MVTTSHVPTRRLCIQVYCRFLFSSADHARRQARRQMSKRGAGTELNKDNYEREIEREGSEEAGTWQKADEVWLM